VSVRDTGLRVRGVLDNHPDGSILVVLGAGDSGSGGVPNKQQLVVVSNWLTALRQRLGGGN